jgi:superfamily II RNA helicase
LTIHTPVASSSLGDDFPPDRAKVGDLVSRIPTGGLKDPDQILDIFLGWITDIGLELYPAQEEALLELMAGRHVILNTPTGSGKSLVAMGLHFKALCEGKTCFYTSPIKALASEKFFSLCDDLGPANVGMQTGDASINPKASIICATAEVLANRALRQGADCGADYVVMDEFHYYGDAERGWSWQVPLITLPGTTFLLMSATLGNTAPIAERLERFTGRKVSLVYSEHRPVPLDFEYRETPLHETVDALLLQGRHPIYIVNFTQRECADLAQNLTSTNLCTRDERDAIRAAIGDFRYDTPYGREIKRYLSFGVGIHHAGLLPKYRLLVEQLAQKGLLKVICGTDTLGVGVNIPIRTVLFTKLSKYDGQKISLLKVRDFKQIAGRAGRRGFDTLGSVVCQAPEHVIEAKKAARDPRKKKIAPKPPPGFVSWTEDTFQKLIERTPEMLKSRFRITHGMVLDLLQRDSELNLSERDNFDSLRELIRRCHDDDAKKKEHLKYAAMLVRSLQRAGIIKMVPDTSSNYYWAVVDQDLQWDFSLFQALALYMVEAIDALDPSDGAYALDVTSLVEAILEDPNVVLYRQVDKVKTDLVNQLKAQGVPYEERMARLETVSHPKPILEFIEATFGTFRKAHPWVRGEDIHPKSIAREIYESYYGFNGYVRQYGLQRSEGVLLRYLSQFYKTLSQTVPELAKTEELYNLQGFFRTMIEHTDTSLIEEWESLLHPELALDREKSEAARLELRFYELFHDPKAFNARVRAELHQLVRALAEADYEEAEGSVWRGAAPGSEEHWPAGRFQAAMAPFLAQYGTLVFDHRARQAQYTRVMNIGPRRWAFTQVLLDPEENLDWYLQGTIDLRDPSGFEGTLLRLTHLGPGVSARDEDEQD